MPLLYSLVNFLITYLIEDSCILLSSSTFSLLANVPLKYLKKIWPQTDVQGH